jgi:F-type H+-transporting ATPase subunit b
VVPDQPAGAARVEPELRQEPRISGEAAVEGEEPGQPEEGGHEGGMPQLEAATFPSQIFWLVVAFATLFYLFRRKALPRVAEILEARQERIAADLDRAARLREEAEAAQRRQQEVVTAAQARAQEQLKAVQDRVAAEIAARQAEEDARVSGRIAEAEARIGAERERALAEVRNVAAEVAQAAVERLAGLKVSEQEARDALGRVTAETA